MDQNVLSPEQRRSLQVFQYNNINTVADPNLSDANESMKPLLSSMKAQNDVLQKNVNTLQSLLDTVKSDPTSSNALLLEEIKWNTYFYKKYYYQTQLMGIIIGICIVINIFHRVVSPNVFIAGTGFILSIAFVYLLYRIWDLTMRDSLNFDEYSFYNYRGNYVMKTDYESTIDASNCALNKIVSHYA